MAIALPPDVAAHLAHSHPEVMLELVKQIDLNQFEHSKAQIAAQDRQADRVAADRRDQRRMNLVFAGLVVVGVAGLLVYAGMTTDSALVEKFIGPGMTMIAVLAGVKLKSISEE